MLARSAAVQVLTAVLSEGRALDEAMERVAARLPLKDRAWLLDVSAGTLRWKGRLDQALDSAALKKKPSGWLRKMLLVGAYQLIAQDRVSPAAVVSETVSEVRKKEGEAPARFANAVLRKVSAGSAQWRALPWNPKASVHDQAAWASLPEWFWRKLADEHGPAWAKAFAEVSLGRPKLWIRAADQDEPVCPSLSGNVSAMSGFAEGGFFVQDVSSQFLVRTISDQVKSALGGPTVRALDLCSAPGGKALGLAWNGFSVLATDSDDARLELVRENVRRLLPETQARGGRCAYCRVPRPRLPGHKTRPSIWFGWMPPAREAALSDVTPTSAGSGVRLT